MESFKRRRAGFETGFARQNESHFMVNMRACSIFAKWVAEEKLGLSERATQRYCDKILSLTVKDCNPTTLFVYIQKRLSRHNLSMSAQELDLQFAKALNQARIETL